MRALLRVPAPRNGGHLSLCARCFLITPASSIFTHAVAPRYGARCSSSSSSSQWKQRQSRDHYANGAKVQNLKSRAAFKLLEMDAKYRLFKRGQTVVDLGYAPGSWSQVAQERTKPNSRIVGIDLLPAQPPRGVSTIQGNFLSPAVQNLVKEYLREFATRPPARSPEVSSHNEDANLEEDVAALIREKSYIDTERQDTVEHAHDDEASGDQGRLVDVVLSDMCEAWPQTAGFSSKTLSNPYRRMMNTSGTPFRDHAGSMDLCAAALRFASDTLRSGGHFVCKFYQGAEDKEFEMKLKKMFTKVHREKPDSSRKESKEAYFVALRRKGDVTIDGN